MLTDPRYKDFKPSTGGPDKKNSKIPVLKGKVSAVKSTKQQDPVTVTTPSAALKTSVLQNGINDDKNSVPPAILVNDVDMKKENAVRSEDASPKNDNTPHHANMVAPGNAQHNDPILPCGTHEETLFVPAAKKTEETDIENDVANETKITTTPANYILDVLENVVIGEKDDAVVNGVNNAMVVVRNDEKYEEILTKEKTTWENTSFNKQQVVKANNSRSNEKENCNSKFDSEHAASGRNDRSNSNSKQASIHSKGVVDHVETPVKEIFSLSHSAQDDDKHKKNSTFKYNEPVEKMKDLLGNDRKGASCNSVHRTSSFALVDTKLLVSIEPNIEPKCLVDPNETVVKLSKLDIKEDISKEENVSSSKEKSESKCKQSRKHNPSKENNDLTFEKTNLDCVNNSSKEEPLKEQQTVLPVTADDKFEASAGNDPAIETIYNQDIHISPGVHAMKKPKDSILNKHPVILNAKQDKRYLTEKLDTDFENQSENQTPPGNHTPVLVDHSPPFYPRNNSLPPKYLPPTPNKTVATSSPGSSGGKSKGKENRTVFNVISNIVDDLKFRIQSKALRSSSRHGSTSDLSSDGRRNRSSNKKKNRMYRSLSMDCLDNANELGMVRSSSTADFAHYNRMHRHQEKLNQTFDIYSSNHNNKKSSKTHDGHGNEPVILAEDSADESDGTEARAGNRRKNSKHLFEHGNNKYVVEKTENMHYLETNSNNNNNNGYGTSEERTAWQ